MKKDNNIKKKVIVIGGANMDIGGRSYAPLVPADSNPGSISIGCGGVGRNIAHDLVKLGLEVNLLTAFGDDFTGNYIKDICTKAGIDISHSLTIKGKRSSIYIYINDDSGDMAMALSHMNILSYITPEYIDKNADIITSSDAVVMDCNISKETYLHLKDICNNNDIPLFIDPVSTAHSEKLKGCLSGIYSLKPNLLEAEYLSDISVKNNDDLKRVALKIIDQGVKRVFISLGEGGIMAADKYACYIAEGLPTDVVSTIGAGDAAAAAIVWASLEGRSLIQAACAANAAASVALSSTDTISPDLSASKVEQIISSINEKECKRI